MAGLVQFDRDTMLAELRDLLSEDELLVFAVYDPNRFEVVYIDEVLESGFGDFDEMYEVGEDLHGYLYTDFIQRELLNDMHPAVGGTRAFVTYLDHVTFIRILDEQSGAFIGISPGTEVTPIIDCTQPSSTRRPTDRVGRGRRTPRSEGRMGRSRVGWNSLLRCSLSIRLSRSLPAEFDSPRVVFSNEST